jgi:hypothetical protein
VCVYARDLNSKVTAKTVKDNINKLIAYGCGKCGASSIDGNDVANGQVKVDFTRGACETGVCKRAGAVAAEIPGMSVPATHHPPTPQVR